MTERRFARFSWLRAGALSCFIAGAALAVTSCAAAPLTALNRGLAHSVPAKEQAKANRVKMLSIRHSIGGCEQRIEHGPRRVPALAIVGASYTAGVGPDNPSRSWAVDLARKLHWDAVVYGVPGAGYSRIGTDDLGPMARLLGAEQLSALSPSLVLIQAGYDDGKVPPDIERQQVRRTIELIRTEAPDARIGLVTVFTGPSRPIPVRFFETDQTIVTAARAADPRAIIMDPLTGHWKYQHADDGLHPTAAGDAWIARKVASILHAHGIGSGPATTAADPAVICDLGVRAPAAVDEDT